MNEKALDTRQILGTYFREAVGEEQNRPQIALASERFRAIDLSCRACGALALGAGLGFPVGNSATLHFHPQPPTWTNLKSVLTLNAPNNAHNVANATNSSCSAVMPEPVHQSKIRPGNAMHTTTAFLDSCCLKEGWKISLETNRFTDFENSLFL